ncbi:Low-density lipoprotein receptor-related protein 1B [Operophtera brumata]|uniref:Low-density lipoprotein receptor-related protein 1B n=1 Tax=Operophtera brumata TaxID=104452 RepID=A0A0L7KN24_OPEBR|nr:Low-density lipoprotein receptor-related protein 1B [Operophtera brumata]
MALRCHDRYDCPDGRDELACREGACASDMFRCTNRAACVRQRRGGEGGEVFILNYGQLTWVRSSSGVPVMLRGQLPQVREL